MFNFRIGSDLQKQLQRLTQEVPAYSSCRFSCFDIHYRDMVVKLGNQPWTLLLTELQAWFGSLFASRTSFSLYRELATNALRTHFGENGVFCL